MKTTPKKKRANRANAKKSTGPRSPRGKAVVSKNSLIHGLCTLEPVLPGEESPEQWDGHRKSIVTRLAPEGAVESALADQIALGYWRLARCARNEAQAIAALREQARWRAISVGLTYEECKGEGRAEALRNLEEAVERATRLAELWGELLDESRLGASITAVEANLLLNDSVSHEAWAKLSVPFNEAFSWPPKKMGEVRMMLDWCGERIYQHPAAWMRGKWVEAGDAARKAEGRLKWIRQSVDLEIALVVLDPRLTATLQRYETAIQRSLHRDLHELQRIQAMRLGITTAIPVAIDVSVD